MAETKNVQTIGWVVHDVKQDFVLEELTLDEMRDDELLVDMKYSGICHTVGPQISLEKKQTLSIRMIE